ncbi:MAG: hypothetical protein ACK4YP_11635 [Myxococcota bacterium]
MSVRYASVLAFLALAACDEVIEHDTEPRADRPVLTAGAYEMVIEDVASLACDVPRSELVGQRLGVMLRVEGDVAILDMDGWVLRGEMAPGSLFVEGTDETMVEVEDDDGAVDHAEDEPTDTDAGEAPPYDVDCEEGHDCGGEERPDEEPPEGRPDDRPHAYASLDGRIFDPGHADGRLTIEMPGCEMALAVTLARGEIEAEPPVEEKPDERPPEERPDHPEEGEASEEG